MSKKANRRHNVEWSAHDVAHMRKLAAAGTSGREASAKLGRSHGAVKYKAMVLGVAFNNIAQPKGVQKRLGRKRRKLGMGATLRAAA